MKITHYASFVLILLICFPLGKLLAQDDCTVKLNQAQKLYEEGKIEKIPSLISDCLESGFNKENKVSALRLLTLVYLFDDNTEMAEKSLVEMLGVDPEYNINPNVDPVEFIRLHKSFRTEPVFALGLFIGNNTSNVRLIQTYSLNDYNKADTKYSNSGMGFCIGGRIIYHFPKKIHLALEPSFSTYSFNFSEQVTENAITKGTQSLNYIDIPLMLSYDFYTYGPVTLYGALGGSYCKFLSGTIDISKTYPNKENVDVTGSSLKAEPTMQPYLATGIIGVGAKYHIPHANIQIGLRYKMGINNAANVENRKTDNLDPKDETLNQLYYKYDYAYDDIGLSSFSVMVGFNYEFFIHKKKNKR